MKSMKRAMRRWKTICKKIGRKEKLERSWGYDSWWSKNSLHEKFLETPAACSCSQCSHKHSWSEKHDTRSMRNEAKKEIDSFYESMEDEDT